jgi:hypothetical protein
MENEDTDFGVGIDGIEGAAKAAARLVVQEHAYDVETGVLKPDAVL